MATLEAIQIGKPYILMVRFWKNVAPLPAGDLMSRQIDRTFTENRQTMFDAASAVITNTRYSAKVIKRWYGRKAIVSYVPIAGEVEPLPYGKFLTIISPEIYGEATLISALAQKLPDNEFLIINPWKHEVARFASMGENVQVFTYRADMREVWAKTRILLLPIYENDICGTRRVTIEGFRHAVPVIANRRCGVWEKIPERMMIDREAGADAWIRKIKEVEEKYQTFQKLAVKAFEGYDTAGQLEVFRREILKAVGEKEHQDKIYDK